MMTEAACSRLEVRAPEARGKCSKSLSVLLYCSTCDKDIRLVRESFPPGAGESRQDDDSGGLSEARGKCFESLSVLLYCSTCDSKDIRLVSVLYHPHQVLLQNGWKKINIDPG